MTAADGLSGKQHMLAPPPSQEEDVEQWTRALITDNQARCAPRRLLYRADAAIGQWWQQSDSGGWA